MSNVVKKVTELFESNHLLPKHYLPKQNKQLFVLLNNTLLK